MTKCEVFLVSQVVVLRGPRRPVVAQSFPQRWYRHGEHGRLDAAVHRPRCWSPVSAAAHTRPRQPSHLLHRPAPELHLRARLRRRQQVHDFKAGGSRPSNRAVYIGEFVKYITVGATSYSFWTSRPAIAGNPRCKNVTAKSVHLTSLYHIALTSTNDHLSVLRHYVCT